MQPWCLHRAYDFSEVLILPLNRIGGSVVKNLSASVGDKGDVGSIPESGRYPGERNGNTLHYLICGQRSLVGYSSWSHKESDVTEATHAPNNILCLINNPVCESCLFVSPPFWLLIPFSFRVLSALLICPWLTLALLWRKLWFEWIPHIAFINMSL